MSVFSQLEYLSCIILPYSHYQNSNNHLTFTLSINLLGGWCYSLTDCQVRSRGCSPGGACGSSWGRGSTTGSPMGGILSSNETVNPFFQSWTKIYAPYCDGNSFSGMTIDPVSFNNSQLYFRGGYNLRAIMNYLTSESSNKTIQNAPTVVLTGCSAGGLAAYLHADFVGSIVTSVNPQADYRVIPVSGFFSNSANAEGAPVYAEQMKGVFYLSNASAGLNQDCINDQDPGMEWVCNLALPSFQYTKSRVFILQSHTDWWQTACVWTAGVIIDKTQNGRCVSSAKWGSCAWSLDGCSSNQAQHLLSWSTRLANDMYLSETGNSQGNGGFITSCHAHCEGNTDSYWMSMSINGLIMRDAVQNWMQMSFNSTPYWHKDCFINIIPSPGPDGRLCNPTCNLHCTGGAIC